MSIGSDNLRPTVRPAVLLAEDDPDQSDMLRETLEDEGYSVDTALTGDAAWRKLLDHNYDMVILDVRMPGRDGDSILKQYRQQPGKASVPVVLVSAFATETDLLRYRANGASASFAKPFNVNELLKTLAALWKKRGRSGRFAPIPQA